MNRDARNPGASDAGEPPPGERMRQSWLYGLAKPDDPRGHECRADDMPGKKSIDVWRQGQQRRCYIALRKPDAGLTCKRSRGSARFASVRASMKGAKSAMRPKDVRGSVV